MIGTLHAQTRTIIVVALSPLAHHFTFLTLSKSRPNVLLPLRQPSPRKARAVGNYPTIESRLFYDPNAKEKQDFPFSGVGFRERMFDVLYMLVGHCFGAGRKEWRKTFLEMGILLHPVSVLLLPVVLWTVPAAADPSIAVHM